MNNKAKKRLILDFINGPLKEYLSQQISFGKFKERVNEICGTDFSYDELYPSYLFNAILSYEEDQKELISDINKVEYNEKLTECHAYGLCISGDPYQFPCSNCPSLKNEETVCSEIIPGTFIACGEAYGEQKQFCSTKCLEDYKKGK